MLSWFINAYPTFASWKATVDRLTGFHTAIDDTAAAARESGVRWRQATAPRSRSTRSTLGCPPVARLVQGRRRDSRGRARAGAWAVRLRQEHAVPRHRGNLAVRRWARAPATRVPRPVPAAAPYFPLGTLHAAVSYPAAPESFTDVHQRGAHRSGPGQLDGRMQEEANWSMQPRAASSSALPSRAPCCTRRTGCSWTRPPPLDEPSQAALRRSCRSAAVHHRGEHRTPAGDVRTPRSHAGDPARRRWSRAWSGNRHGRRPGASAFEAPRSARAVDRAQLAPRKAQRSWARRADTCASGSRSTIAVCVTRCSRGPTRAVRTPWPAPSAGMPAPTPRS